MDRNEPARTEVQRTIDREAELLASAIYMVASGAARSTTVAGLKLADAAILVVAALAADHGMILEPLWGDDEAGFDVRVRRASGS